MYETNWKGDICSEFFPLINTSTIQNSYDTIGYTYKFRQFTALCSRWEFSTARGVYVRRIHHLALLSRLYTINDLIEAGIIDNLDLDINAKGTRRAVDERPTTWSSTVHISVYLHSYCREDTHTISCVENGPDSAHENKHSRSQVYGWSKL